MEIMHVATVLSSICEQISDHDLIIRYEALIAALDSADSELIYASRLKLRQGLEAATWWGTEEGEMVGRQYGADLLLGQNAPTDLDHLFLRHYLQPQAVATHLRQQVTQLQALEANLQNVLQALQPVLQPRPTSTLLEGDVIPHHNAQRALSPLHRFDLSAIPAKLLAATPVLFVAAGKAIELYRHYQEKKSPHPPVEKNRPIYPPHKSSSIFYAYRQTTIQIIEEK